MNLQQRKMHILDLLGQERRESSPIILSEVERGTASWMARQTIESATTSHGLCSESLWVSLTKNYDTRWLHNAICAIWNHLPSGSIPEEWEYEDENAKLDKPAQGLKVTTVDWEREGKSQNAQHVKRKPVLLVLDCEGNDMDNNEFKQNVLPMLSSFNPNRFKVIIARCVARGEEAIQGQTELGPLSPDDSFSLLLERIGEQRVSKIPDFNIQFSDAIKEKASMHWPAAITVIAGAFNDIVEYDALKNALQKAVYFEKPCQDGVNPLLYYAYDMMRSDVTKNCFWHSLQFVLNYGGVHFNELITHWIMEGYFDPFDHIEKAYQAGHAVLMELIDRAILKMQENNIVVVEGAALNMIDTRPSGFGGTASLGLVRVFENGEGFGRVTHIDGMIKTLCDPTKQKDVSTLLMDGARFSHGMMKTLCHPTKKKDVSTLLTDGARFSRLDSSVPEEFFGSMPRLKVLAVFHSGYKQLISSLSGLKELDVLVLRNCDLLDDTTHISNLTTLRVLEISESRDGEYSSLMSIPENMLHEMTHLQSLNLSGLQIESLPSLSKLIKLRLLILRRCSRLEKLQSLKGLANLEILDLSGSESFENFHDTSFSEIPNIQLIDFSHTKIQKLPVFGELKHLTRILLRGCSNKLRQLPRLQHLSSLQILDLSGASEFRNFMFKDLIAELNQLKVLNLSKTKISKLPPIPCNLSELNLSGCSELVELPSTTSLKNLELLDVSDAPKLAKINHESFQHLTYLRYINFSNTKVEKLPTLSNLRNLRQVLLRNCTLLRNLPAMEGVTRLEELDLSGCSALQVNENIESFGINV